MSAGERERRPFAATGKRAAASSSRARTSGSARLEPRDADAKLGELRLRSAANPGTSASIIATQRPRRRAPSARRGRSSARAGRRRRRARARSVGLKPTIPQQAAGIRIEPAGVGAERRVGEPGRERRRRAAARAARRAARARPGSAPCRSGRSARCRRRRTRAGSSCRRSRSRPPRAGRTASAVSAGTWSANTAEPYVVRTPAVSNRSLTASRIPGPGSSSVMKIPSRRLGR